MPIFFEKKKKKGNSHFAGRKYAYIEIALEPLCQSWESKFKIRNSIAYFQVESHNFPKEKKNNKIKIM
jgi:hypothetical protein